MEKLNKLKLFANRVYHLFFCEYFNKSINFRFEQDIYRWDLINKIINKNKFTSYLEIGCDDNTCFDRISIKNKIGVDPVSGGNLRITSDNFFIDNKKKFDLIFIDGLHTYEQVKKDISNSINSLNDNGYILVHDCLPSRISHQAIPRYKGYWNGEVWKAIVEFRTKKEINIITCLIDTGIAVIKKKTNEDLLPYADFNFKKLKFEFFFNNYQKLMRLISWKDFNTIL